MDDWPFDSPQNEAVLTVMAVLAGHPILYVARDAADGGWQFLTGGPVAEADARMVGLGTLVASDPTLRQVADLPPGWIARRASKAAPWHRGPRSG